MTNKIHENKMEKMLLFEFRLFRFYRILALSKWDLSKLLEPTHYVSDDGTLVCFGGHFQLCKQLNQLANCVFSCEFVI